MSHQQSNLPPTTQGHACDNCKARKTKCDRGAPCSSCVTAKVQCRTTEKPPQRRQRVLISSKYEDHMQDVSQRLQSMSGALQILVERSERSTPGSSDHGPLRRPSNFPSPGVRDIDEGFKGDSSFDAHAASLASAMQSQGLPLHESAGLQILRGLPALNSRAASEIPGPTPLVDWDERSMPPVKHISRLLRLVLREKQRFFYDVPIIGEQEFVALCHTVCFPTESYSLSKWIIVNVGLYYLFHGLPARHYNELDVTHEAVQEFLEQLAENVDVAVQDLRLFLEPSFETCSALIMTSEYYCKNGHKTTAWSLVSAASRMGLDLGLHRFDGDDVDDLKVHRRRMLFWWIYAYDHGLAFTLGRAPTIHHYDVTTQRPDFERLQPGMCSQLYNAWLDFAVVAGEIQYHLFSAFANRSSQSVKAERATALASRLKDILGSFTRVGSATAILAHSLSTKPMQETERSQGDVIMEKAAVTLSIIMNFLLAVVYRTIPVNHPEARPIRWQEECTRTAQRGLEELVNVGDSMITGGNARGWRLLLNVLLSFVPFTAFIILVSDAIATLSHEKLALLSSVLNVVAPAVESSPSTKKTYETCRRFYQFAEVVVAEKSAVHSQETTQRRSSSRDAQLQSSFDPAPSNEMMSQAEWEEVMRSLDMDLGERGSQAMAGDVDPFTVDWASP